MERWYSPLILAFVIFLIGYGSSGVMIGFAMGMGALVTGVLVYAFLKLKGK
ncbi:hypothetical protein Q7A53_03435 [Halobacillus rhizosphaerae]|uniref:hypothetical protein n=1 Tax=Halobacillus rhizosphaerae TaxID=3064889 RepID=UPI00398AD62C